MRWGAWGPATRPWQAGQEWRRRSPTGRATRDTRNEAGKGDPLVKFIRSAAAIGTIVALAGAAAGCGSSGSSGGTSATAAPAKLTIWRMGATVPPQVSWMNGVVAPLHQQVPPDHKTKATH